MSSLSFKSLPQIGVAFEEAESFARLARSRHRANFAKLVNHYRIQPDRFTCGPTSAAIVLDALRAPGEPFTNAVTERIKPLREVRGKVPGVELGELARMCSEGHGLRVKQIVAESKTLRSLSSEMKKSLKTPGQYLIAHYSRPALGQSGGGHFSPIGAYDKTSDSFLVIDVNPAVAPWMWVESHRLLAAMNTRDLHGNRGALIVSDR